MTASKQNPKSVLITNGDYFGSLAAARHFSRSGYTVRVADVSAECFSAASKHSHEYLPCPPAYALDAMADRLEDIGKLHPDTLLYPCSDDLAWVISAHRQRLARHFQLYQPPLETIEALLDKGRLYRLCTKLDIPIPHTLCPENPAELAVAAAEIKGKYLIKPRTQIGLPINQKSELQAAGPGLMQAYLKYRERYIVGKGLAHHDPRLTWPMLQEFNPNAARHTISVAGFCSESAKTFLAASSRKVLQFPMQIGTGLCFESVPVDKQLAQWVRQICMETGYFGVFEVEFISQGTSFQLMDFNPRYYGQMQLEISRGLNPPACVVAAVSGVSLPAPAEYPPARIGRRSLLRTVMTTQWLAGRISWSERKKWLDFLHPGEQLVADHIFDPEDPAPARRELISRLLHYLRYPRSSLRRLFGSA